MNLTRCEIIVLLVLVSSRIEELEDSIKLFENDTNMKVMFLNELKEAKNIKDKLEKMRVRCKKCL